MSILNSDDALIVRRYIDTLALVGMAVPRAVHNAATRLAPTAKENELWHSLLAAGCELPRSERWPDAGD